MTSHSSFLLSEKLKATKVTKVLTFDDYLERVRLNPRRMLRDSLTYVRDCIDYFGSYKVMRHGVQVRRFALFDAPFDQGRDRLVGQEGAQNDFYGWLESQLSMGRSPRLFLLHGPNGSAKSTFFRTLMRGLEAYSDLEEGARYRFNWIFPSGTYENKGIGFGAKSGEKPVTSESYALLDSHHIDALLPDEFRDLPILLIPADIRREIISQWVSESDDPDFTIPHWIECGNLHPRNRQICDALLLSSPGLMDVYRYIQVERYSLSRRYRRGLVTVEPKMAADATIRQITADKSLSSLPPSLQNLELYRYGGDLVDANAGLIEFADLFKKPVEGFKYLINTLEEGYLNLDAVILQFNLCFTGSVNDRHLMAFTETSEFASFEGRTEFVSMPYLLSFELEQEIQRQALENEHFIKKISPHILEAVGLWAVMTRLVKPVVDDTEIMDIISELNVYEKAILYDRGLLPRKYPTKIEQRIRSILPDLAFQRLSAVVYEGGIGASPRLVRSLLLRAATRYDTPWLSAVNVFKEMERLGKDKSTHEFLNYPAQEGGYHDYKAIVAFALSHWESQVARDLWAAAELVDVGATNERLERYITTIIHYIKGEKIKDEMTGAYMDPSESAMKSFENELGITEDPYEYRSSCISRIGAYKIDFPEENVQLPVIFSRELETLTEKMLSERSHQLKNILEGLLVYLSTERESSEEVSGQLEAVRKRLLNMGYTDEMIVETVDYYVRKNLAE
ncbi:hypothetical protein KKF84_00680 [Myxococcota bacterium]|nr:hypothetical protein [Myxococcota bacterium]